VDALVLLALGMAPGLLWLAFFLKEDLHPEPRKMITKTFIMGGLSALMALLIEFLSLDLVKKITLFIPGVIEDSIANFVIFAVIEEIVKFYFVWKVVHKSPYLDEPIDAMIYMVTGALGFATAENFFLIFSRESDIFTVILMRFIGATLLHALCSAIIGYMWAWSIKKRKIFAPFYLASGLIFASLVHAIFNILVAKFNLLLIYPTVFLGIVGFIVLYDFEKLRYIEEQEEKRGEKLENMIK
jgi:RsiW-degrading membrane proteinase PrsW (M82 family)